MEPLILAEIRDRHLAWEQTVPRPNYYGELWHAAGDRAALLAEVDRLSIIVALAQTYCATRRGIADLEAALGVERTTMKRGKNA